MFGRETSQGSAVGTTAVRGSFQVADIITLPSTQIERDGVKQQLAAGSALRVPTTHELIATSRRDGGLPHRFGVFEGANGEAVGAVFVKADSVLHIVFLDLGAPEVQALLADAERAQTLRVLFVSETNESRLMIPPVGDGLQMLIAASRGARALGVPAYIEAMTEAMKIALSAKTFAHLELDVTKLRRVELSYVVADSTAADMERKVRGHVTLN